MAGDDKEKSPAPPLPASVERALARARAAARADHDAKGGRWLAVIPVGIAAVLLLLMMPRAVAPVDVPLPAVDQRVLAEVARRDDKLAAFAEAQRLPTDVLAVGSALRAFNQVEVSGDDNELLDARRRLEGTLREAFTRRGVEADLLTLRALETRRFLDALTTWEKTGKPPEDLVALGGGFAKRAENAGWVESGHVVLDDGQRRAAFKTVWNALTRLERPAFALSLDEQRTLYVLYIQHPHPSDASRPSLEDARRSATTPEACARARSEESRQTEQWRADKIKRLGAIDPSYPTGYALGVVYYRAGRYELATDAFNAFLEAHPEGPFAIRARNHLKAALAGGVL